MKMTLTQILSKLKILDKRISSKIYELEREPLIEVTNKDKKEEVKSKIEREGASKLQSLNKLIENRAKLKAALNQANATTTVVINNKKMTIAQVLDYKKIIEYKKNLLNTLTNQYNNALIIYKDKLKIAEEKANEIIETKLGNEAKNSKSSEVKELFDIIYQANAPELVDPIDIKKEIDSLKKEIDNFEENIDVVLSTINATVVVDVDID